VNQEPLAFTEDEIDDILADLDRALDFTFLREIDEALERIGVGHDPDQLGGLSVAAG